MERIRITVQFDPRNPDRTSERTCGTIRLKRVLRACLLPWAWETHAWALRLIAVCLQND